MQEDSPDTEAWRRVCLGDEPIYCAAPPPTNSNDIICPGSDDGLDDTARVAKRLRYEAQGRRYLEGEPMRILSASLRGPFDKASGWQNPWLPKQPAVKQPFLKATQSAAKSFPIIEQGPRGNYEQLAQQNGQDGQDGATPGTTNSMRCHLPSPDSIPESQFLGDPSESDKHNRIQAWAREVSLGTLERDAFWAPEQILDEEPREPSKKRPAGREWLKKKLSKRKRLGSLQSTAAASTPTPIPLSELFTQTPSAHGDAKQTKASALPRKMASHSFELTTPSSSADLSVREPVHREHAKVSTSCRTMPPRHEHELSHTSRPATNESIVRLTSNTADEIDDQSSAGNLNSEQKPKNFEASDNSEHALKESPDEEAQRDQEAGDMSFESYLDQSFHYRARPPKQTIPCEIASPDTPMVDICPKLTQTETPQSSRHKDAVLVTVPEAKELSQFSQQETAIASEQQVCVEPAAAAQGPEHPPNSIHGEQDENASVQGEELVSALSTLEKSISKNQQGTDDEKSCKCHKLCPGNPTVVEAHSSEPEVRLDEEPTLIDDPMNIDQSEPHEVVGSPPTSQVCNVPNLEVTSTMSTVGSHAMTQVSTKHATREDESNTKSNPATAPSSQLELDVANIVTNPPKKSELLADGRTKTLEVKVEAIPNKDASVQATLSESSQRTTQQSPRTSDTPPRAELGIEHVTSEPMDDVPSPQVIHLNPQIGNDRTPPIRPSQQSPWIKELVEQTTVHKEDQPTAITDSLPANATLNTTDSEECPSPWDGANTNTMHYPRYPSIPPAVAEESVSQHLQPSISSIMPARQSPEILAPSSATSRIRTPRPLTPEPELSIKSFANFHTPTPKYQLQPTTQQVSSTSYIRGILSSGTHSNPWGSRQTGRSVSFAPLPNEESDTYTPPAYNAPRPASPPPQTMGEAEEEDVGDHFQNHFETIRRRSGGEDVQFRFQPRLLPSSSQRKPMSPKFSAMAETFQEADAHVLHGRCDTTGDTENTDQEMTDIAQSPWRKESQGVDDVAAVMGNLDEFLGTWDMEAEMKQVEQESIGAYGNLWD
ncbi:hypothetical protein AAE478_006063 [Parahypoxylon ruwenzoriense]